MGTKAEKPIIIVYRLFRPWNSPNYRLIETQVTERKGGYQTLKNEFGRYGLIAETEAFTTVKEVIDTERADLAKQIEQSKKRLVILEDSVAALDKFERTQAQP